MDDMNNPTPQALGISGRIAALFQSAQITPLLALVAFLLGVFAVMVTPREEEPQINVTMANVLIPFPGASVADVEQMVATPAEQVLSQMAGTEHVMSISRPGVAVLTVQFKVGVKNQDAIVRLYDTIHSNQDWLSPQLGVIPPIVKPKGIDDVPVVALTLWTRDPARSAFELQQVGRAVELELKRVKGTRDVATIGGPGHVMRVLMDPGRMNAFGITPQDLKGALLLSNASQPSGTLTRDNREVLVQTGTYIASADDVRKLVVGVSGGKPVYLADVADVLDGPDQPSRFVWHGLGKATAGAAEAGSERFPAVTQMMDEAEADVLAYFSFPKSHRVKLHSTNTLERLNKEVKRRADVVGIFPNEESIMRLLGAVLAEQNEEWLLQNRYLPQQSMAEINRVSDEVIEALPLSA